MEIALGAVGGGVVATYLRVVMTLDGCAEFVEEFEEPSGGLVGEIGGDAHHGQVVGFSHGDQRIFLAGFRDLALAAARSWASLSR